MSRLLVVVVTTVAISIGVVPADAAAIHHVSRHEYHRVQVGMSKHRVHEIFDTHGWSMQLGPRKQTRVYQGWRPNVQVYVTYRLTDRWRLVRKYAEATAVAREALHHNESEASA